MFPSKSVKILLNSRSCNVSKNFFQWSESDEKRVSLKNLQFEASGVYICEVTTDNPIYTKPSEEEYLTVMRKY